MKKAFAMYMSPINNIGFFYLGFHSSHLKVSIVDCRYTYIFLAQGLACPTFADRVVKNVFFENNEYKLEIIVNQQPVREN